MENVKNNKPSVIIVEGPDCAGKTSICNFLAQLTGFNYVHLTDKDPAVLDTYVKCLDKHNVILDRFYFSEFIYANVVRCGKSTFSADDFITLKEKLATMNVLTIYVTNKVEVLEQRALTRGESFVSNNQLKTVKELYDIMFDSPNTPHVKLELNL
jgi:thymidylate kinase